jgi:hypothetical protein
MTGADRKQETTMFHTSNTCSGLQDFARASFGTLAEAMDYKTPAGGPNKITADDGREWTRGSYANQPPRWFQTR